MLERECNKRFIRNEGKWTPQSTEPILRLTATAVFDGVYHDAPTSSKKPQHDDEKTAATIIVDPIAM